MLKLFVDLTSDEPKLIAKTKARYRQDRVFWLNVELAQAYYSTHIDDKTVLSCTDALAIAERNNLGGANTTIRLYMIRAASLVAERRYNDAIADYDLLLHDFSTSGTWLALSFVLFLYSYSFMYVLSQSGTHCAA